MRMTPAILLTLSLLSMLLLYLIAGRRGANRKFWVIMGLLFGPLALPFVFFSRKKNRH